MAISDDDLLHRAFDVRRVVEKTFCPYLTFLRLNPDRCICWTPTRSTTPAVPKTKSCSSTVCLRSARSRSWSCCDGCQYETISNFIGIKCGASRWCAWTPVNRKNSPTCSAICQHHQVREVQHWNWNTFCRKKPDECRMCQQNLFHFMIYTSELGSLTFTETSFTNNHAEQIGWVRKTFPARCCVAQKATILFL